MTHTTATSSKKSRAIIVLLALLAIVAAIGCGKEEQPGGGNGGPVITGPVQDECNNTCDAQTQVCNSATKKCEPRPVIKDTCNNTCDAQTQICDNGTCKPKPAPSVGSKNCAKPCALGQYCDHTSGTCKTNTKTCPNNCYDKDDYGKICVNGECKYLDDTCATPCAANQLCDMGSCQDESNFATCPPGPTGKHMDPRTSACVRDGSTGNAKVVKLNKDNACANGGICWKSHCERDRSNPFKYSCVPDVACTTPCKSNETCDVATGKCKLKPTVVGAGQADPNSCNLVPCTNSTNTCITSPTKLRECRGEDFCSFPVGYTGGDIELNKPLTLEGSFANTSGVLEEQWNGLCATKFKGAVYVPIKLKIPATHGKVALSYKFEQPDNTYLASLGLNGFDWESTSCPTTLPAGQKYPTPTTTYCDQNAFTISDVDAGKTIILFLYTDPNPTKFKWKLTLTATNIGGDQCQESSCNSDTKKIDKCLLVDEQNPTSTPAPSINQKATYACTTQCVAKSGSTPAHCEGNYYNAPITLKGDVTSHTVYTEDIYPAAYAAQNLQPFDTNSHCSRTTYNSTGLVAYSTTFKLTNLPKGATVAVKQKKPGDGHDAGGGAAYVVLHTTESTNSCVAAADGTAAGGYGGISYKDAPKYTMTAKGDLFVTYYGSYLSRNENFKTDHLILNIEVNPK